MTLRVGERSRRERSAVLLALGVHVLALVLCRVLPAPWKASAPPALPAFPVVAELGVEVEAEAPAVLPASSEVSRAPTAVAIATPHSEGRRASSHDREPSEPPTPGTVVDAPGGTWSFSPQKALPPLDLSLGATRYKLAVSDPAAVDATTLTDRTPRVFGALNEHDAELGLGRGGAIGSAVEEAVRTSEHGTLGTALFDVTLDHGGGVRVDLVQSSGDSSPWSALTDPIARAAKTKSIRIPERSHGLRVRVRVEAREKLADGRDVTSLGNGVHATLGEVGTDSVAMKELPNVGIEHRGKVCSGKLAIGPTGGDLAAATNFGVDQGGGGGGALPSLLTPITLGGGCSVENIGAPARRMVTARVVSETTL